MAAPGPSSRSRTQKTADEPGGLPEPVNKKQKDERLARRIEENTARYATFKAALGNIDELVDEERARKRDPVLALLLDRQYEDRKRRQDAIDAAAGGTDLELVLAAYFQGRLHFGFEDEPIEEVVWQDPAFAANLEKMVPALAELIRKPFTTDPANLPGVKLVGKLDVSSIGGMFPTESEFEADFEQAAPIDPDGLEAADVDDRDGDASETPNTGNEPLPPSDEHGLHIYLRCLPYGGADDLIHDQKRTAFLFPGTQPRVFPKIATLNALLHAADGAPFPVFDIYVGISWGRGKDASVVRARKELVAIKKGELMTTNARFMQARERGSNELLIYEWVDLAFNPSLKKAHHRAREKDRNGQLCERLAIGCLWDSTENSADGGFLAGKARLSDDLKEVREGVARWEASQGVDGWDDGGAANPRIQAEVRELFRLLAAVLKWFPKADVGPEMDSVCLEAAIERAAWVPTFCGFVIKYLMHKDVPRESHQDPALAGFQRQDGMVGRGGHEFECNARFANPAIPDPPRRTGFGPNAVQYNLWLAVYFGPMVDFWSIILKHVLIWIVIIIKVRLLQIVRPLILVTHSSKISELVREGYFKSIFDVSNPAVKRFICDGEVPTSREDMAKLVIVVIVITIVWRELPMSKWIDHVGTIAIVPIGPFANSTALNVAALDSGVIKYDPAHGPLYREVEIATNLIINILMTVIKRMIKDGDRPDQDDAEQLHDWQLRAKAEAERAIEQLGVGKVLKDKIDELKMLQTWYFSNRNASAAWRSDFAKVEAGASVAEVTIERSNRQTVIARGWLEKSRFARGLPGSDERKQQAEELFGEAKERDRNGLPPPRWMPKAWAGKLENIVPWIMRLAAEGDNINMSARSIANHPTRRMTEEELQARADHCFGDMVRAFKVWTACFDTPLEMVQKVGNEANFGANRGKSPSGKMLGAIVHCISCGSAHVAKDTNVKHQCTQEATRYPVYGKTNVHPFVIRESLSNITQLLEHDVLGELFELADTADGRSEVVVFVKDKKGVTRVRSGMVSFDVREILMTKPSATFLPRWREQLTAHPDISLGQVFALANSSDAFLVTLAGARFFELWPSAIDDNLNAEESEILNETAENLDFKIKSLLDGFKASQPLFFPAGCAAPEGSCGAMRLSFAPRGQLQHRCEAAREALSLKQPPKKDFRRMTDRPLAAARSLLDFPRLWRRRIWMARNRGSDNEHDVAVELWGLGRFS